MIHKVHDSTQVRLSFATATSEARKWAAGTRSHCSLSLMKFLEWKRSWRQKRDWCGSFDGFSGADSELHWSVEQLEVALKLWALKAAPRLTSKVASYQTWPVLLPPWAKQNTKPQQSTRARSIGYRVTPTRHKSLSSPLYFSPPSTIQCVIVCLQVENIQIVIRLTRCLSNRSLLPPPPSFCALCDDRYIKQQIFVFRGFFFRLVLSSSKLRYEK